MSAYRMLLPCEHDAGMFGTGSSAPGFTQFPPGMRPLAALGGLGHMCKAVTPGPGHSCVCFRHKTLVGDLLDTRASESSVKVPKKELKCSRAAAGTIQNFGANASGKLCTWFSQLYHF